MGDLTVVGRALSSRLGSDRPTGLCFQKAGGPVVAVVGLTGGAGTSTIADALARQAARESPTPVLLTELEGERAGLAVLTGAASPMGLDELARRVAAGDQPKRAFIEPEPRLRLLASTPRHSNGGANGEVTALLRHAREAHGLVVIDCGAVGSRTRELMSEATHIVWTLSASRAALARATLFFEGDVLTVPGRAREALVVSAIQAGRGVSGRALRRLAEGRCERVVLMPNTPLVDDPAQRVLSFAPVLTALAGFLRECR